MCKGKLKEAFSNFTADIGTGIVVIKNVPSLVCSQCGEASYSDEVAYQLEQIVRRITDSASAEIAVVNYSEKAA
jgi:YgiT-type zinc finger domain-containing protein